MRLDKDEKLKLKRKAIEISSSNIFENDKLQRRESVRNLTELLKNIDSPVVFSINAPWGSGKTTYLRMLHASLELETRKPIYFSAWETDFAADPLLAFLGEINLNITSFIGGDKKKSKAWEQAKKAGAHILKRGVPIAVKLATAGIVDADKILEEEVSKFAEGLSKDVIDSYSKNKLAIVEFKENIKKVLGVEGGDTEKLYIFIDELDRCRPTYAIELLERIKHLLDIEGLVFVLALDKNQLAHSVKAVYGSEFDAVGYLKRFIDVEFSLPAADVEPYIEFLADQFELGKYFESDRGRNIHNEFSNLISVIKVLALGQKMSLRTIEQLFSKIKLILLAGQRNHYVYPELMVFLLFVKDVYPMEYSNFSRAESDGEELIELIYKVIIGGDEARHLKQDIHALIIACKFNSGTDWAREHLKKLKEIGASQTSSDISRSNCNRTVELAEHYTRMGRGIILERIVSRVDMVSDFNFDR